MEKHVENLRKNGFTVTEFATGREAAAYLLESVHGKTVGLGGSVTLQQLDIYDRLGQNNTVAWHLVKPGDDTLAAAGAADVYITSANAVSEEGFILNIDGRGNRVSATLSKKEKVYFVIGENKLSGPMPEALERARNIAAPFNARRLNRKTPCAVDNLCHDCASPERICSALVVLWHKPSWCESMEVLLVHENLGY